MSGSLLYPQLGTERLILRLPPPEEAWAVGEYARANRLFHEPWSPTRLPEHFTDPHWVTKLADARDDWLVRRASLVFYLFARAEPGRIVGRIGYSAITRGVAQFCFLGYELDAQSQGRGYMTEALRASNAYVFEKVGLHRIMANFIPRNEASGAVLKRLGFVFEGYARDYLRINGRWEDHVLTALTNKEWKAEG